MLNEVYRNGTIALECIYFSTLGACSELFVGLTVRPTSPLILVVALHVWSCGGPRFNTLQDAIQKNIFRIIYAGF